MGEEDKIIKKRKGGIIVYIKQKGREVYSCTLIIYNLMLYKAGRARKGSFCYALRNCSVPSQLRAASALESAALMGACSYIIYVFLRNMRYRIFLY